MEVVMPKVGLTMTEGVVAQWHKHEGDFVRKGELLFTFETEKSTLEYESPEEGTLTKIIVLAGQTVACFTPVALIGEASSIQHPVPINRPPISPRARMKAKELGVELAQVTGTGPDGAIRERDIQSAIPRGLSVENQQPKISKATPLAQRLASELGVDLATITGTGPDGKITREDVERVSLSPARRLTAQRMAANAQTAPHVTLYTEADATELVSARSQLNAELKGKISYNTLLVAICARALREHPALNASWVDETHDAGRNTSSVLRLASIDLHSSINIGLAVDTPRGLFVPVLKDAGTKPLAQIHQELTDLVNRTLEGKAQPGELSGGTFTITNLGMFEIDSFTPIINLPEAAILGVGRIVAKPVARGEQVVVRQMMTLSLSFDHRVVDGAPAATFLQRIKHLIERPFALMI